MQREAAGHAQQLRYINNGSNKATRKKHKGQQGQKEEKKEKGGEHRSRILFYSLCSLGSCSKFVAGLVATVWLKANGPFALFLPPFLPVALFVSPLLLKIPLNASPSSSWGSRESATLIHEKSSGGR